MQIVFDIETNGLLPEVDTIWCIVMQDIATDETYKFKPNEIDKGLALLSQATTLIGHNIVGYDLPVLKHIKGWVPNEDTEIVDTYIMSRLLNPDRRKPSGFTGKGGPHSLEAWGYRVSKAKPAHEEWSVFSPAMLRRCTEDVGINVITHRLLSGEMKGHNWDQALEIEHKVQAIVTEQESTGVHFNLGNANDLVSDLNRRIKSIDDELLPNLPVSYKCWGVSVSRPFIKTGNHSKMVLDWFNKWDDPDGVNDVGGPFTRVEPVQMNLGSMVQVKDYLLKLGWQPTEWNYKDGERTSPKLTEDSYVTIRGEMGKLIKDRVLYSHRRSQVEGWISRLRADGRITAGANTIGTNTRRFRHHGVVNVPKAAAYVPFGKEMRELFCASEGRQIVGHDASGLELRMLAHYMNDEAYTYELLHGDIHTTNQLAAGLNTRDDAKTFIYAFLYGAGDEKIGSIVGGSSAEGADLKRRFLSGLPALGRLIKRVKRASDKGWLRGLDNGKIWMRRNEFGEVMKHKALNTLLQSAGAVVMKQSMIRLDEWKRRDSLDALKVIDMHDEAQHDVILAHVDQFAELAEQSVVQSGKDLNLNIALAAEAKIGMNWAETH
jgi:DNA polymerase I-like protein with 3'-5' exonuclease and polymerase domains